MLQRQRRTDMRTLIFSAYCFMNSPTISTSLLFPYKKLLLMTPLEVHSSWHAALYCTNDSFHILKGGFWTFLMFWHLTTGGEKYKHLGTFIVYRAAGKQ